MGFLTKPDSTLYRHFFKEMARLRGIPVKYQYPIHIDTTIHAEMLTQLSDPQDIDIIFDANPRVNTLKKIGWVSENPDDKPYIAQLAFDTPNLMVECVITIPSIYTDLNINARRFKITSINTIMEFPDCWTCTLAPIFNTEEPNNDYDDSNYNFVNTSDAPQSDTPDNKKGGSCYCGSGEHDGGEYFKI